MKYNLIALAVCALAAGTGLGAGGAYVVLNRMPQAQQPVVPAAPAIEAAAPAVQNETPPVAAQPMVPEPVPSQSVAIQPPAPVPPEALAVAPAQNGDAARALDGVQKQQFLPLQTISDTVRARYPGDVVSAKLDEDDGVMKYELKILTKNGRILEVDVDPRSGRILDVDEDD